MFLTLPKEIIIHEINKYLVEIDKQILRKVNIYFYSMFPFKQIFFDETDLELVHIRRYQKFWTLNTMNNIAKKGDLECLKYLHSPPSGEPCQWNNWTPAYAARGGHLRSLKYLHENGCPWDSTTPALAAKYGQLECLKYAHSPGSGKPCPWDSATTVWAASGGHLECLKYAHSPGSGEPCPWDSETTAYAALNGNIQCLKYAHENGCSWNFLTITFSSTKDDKEHLECLKYARENGCS